MFLHNELPLTVLVSIEFSHKAVMGESKLQRVRNEELTHIFVQSNKYLDNGFAGLYSL